MRKFAIGLRALFWRIPLFVWRLCGKMEDDMTVRQVASGKSWSEPCDTLKVAGVALRLPSTPRDSFNKAIGPAIHPYCAKAAGATTGMHPHVICGESLFLRPRWIRKMDPACGETSEALVQNYDNSSDPLPRHATHTL